MLLLINEISVYHKPFLFFALSYPQYRRNKYQYDIFMVTPCINDIKWFIVQLMHSNI